MNLELTEEDAKSLLDLKNKEIASLRKRLRRIDVHLKYFDTAAIYVERKMIEGYINYLNDLMANDRGAPGEYYEPMYDHSAIEEAIEKYTKILADEKYGSVRMNFFSHEYLSMLLPRNGNSRHLDDSIMYHLREMKKESRKEGEPETPSGFSSNDEKNGL